jgi:outer membrane immunogenic protein
MHWWACGLLIAMTCPALAADYDDSWLRGSQTIGPSVGPPPRLYRIWAGVYGGAQVGEDFHGVDFRSTPASPLASAISQDAILSLLSASLPGMPNLSQVNSNGPSYGGFVGYNWQIDDVVFGVEINANRSSLNQSAYSSVTRSYVVNYNSYLFSPTVVNVNNSGTADMSDYFTLRGRLGWAFGNFLPYVVAGVSFAQIDSSQTADINYRGTCVTTTTVTCPPNFTIGGNYPFANVSHGKYVLGFDGALGMDYLLTKYLFVRGEVEYLQLGQPSDIRVNTVSARTAIGLKF